MADECALGVEKIPCPTHLPHSDLLFQFSHPSHKWMLHACPCTCTVKFQASAHRCLMFESQLALVDAYYGRCVQAV